MEEQFWRFLEDVKGWYNIQRINTHRHAQTIKDQNIKIRALMRRVEELEHELEKCMNRSQL